MVKLQELIELAGYEVRPYSGRGLKGNECLATNPGPSTLAFVADLIVAAVAEDVDVVSALDGALRSAQTDSMGPHGNGWPHGGTVLYFPNTPFDPEI